MRIITLLILFSLAACQPHYEWQSAEGKSDSLDADLEACGKHSKTEITYNGVKKSTPFDDCMNKRGHEYTEMIWNMPADKYAQGVYNTMGIMNAY